MRKVTMPNFCINFLTKTVKLLPILYDFAVASLADAWIKIARNPVINRGDIVASFVGAWIKIRGKYIMDNVKVRRTSHGCVD